MMSSQTKPATPAATSRRHRGGEQNALHSQSQAILSSGDSTLSPVLRSPSSAISLLTAGRDRPYALGMAAALTAVGLTVEFIGSNDLDVPELRRNPRVRFLNLRGEQGMDANFIQKVSRVIAYYLGLLRYAATAKPRIFHILWNNKFELFDRTLLMLYYKWLGKKVVFTAHNVNAGKRDSNDNWLNRLSLKIQYRLSDHIFVHTRQMKEELVSEYGVAERKIEVIPFGLNRTVPDTALSTSEARQRLGLVAGQKVILFFGNIAPYKGLELLVEAFETVAKTDQSFRLIVAGRPKGPEDYWSGLLQKIKHSAACARIILKIEYVPDAETEIYFKAADVLVLPYTHIFQSGVLFLGYGFGLPAIAADVGSLREEIIEGESGFMFPAKDCAALSRAIHTYFSSALFKELEVRRSKIQNYANERYSWAKVAGITTNVYGMLLELNSPCPPSFLEKSVPRKT